jgi:HEAT repeat protein
LAAEAERRRTIALAGHAGDVATAIAALGDESPRVRATALAALARLERLEDAPLIDALMAADADLRRRAVALAMPHPDIDLLPLLADSDPMVAETAAWALGEREDVAAVPALASMATNHADPLCREAAVAALGAIGDERGLAAILHATADKPAVRRRAVLALAPFEGPEVKAALQAALADRDWQVRQAAEDLLADD